MMCSMRFYSKIVISLTLETTDCHRIRIVGRAHIVHIAAVGHLVISIRAILSRVHLQLAEKVSKCMQTFEVATKTTYYPLWQPMALWYSVDVVL